MRKRQVLENRAAKLLQSKTGLKMRPGATLLEKGRCYFQVWAPEAEKVELHILGPHECYLPMVQSGKKYFEITACDISPGTLYRYRLDGEKEYPDPASCSQPQGVSGPSEVVQSAFNWQDRGWYGLPLQEYIIYELHVGAFTPEGTLTAIIPHLDELVKLGITAVELMPVAQFPGGRNWGYDGVYPYAVQNTYGGVPGLKQLVNACHRKGLAVVLDVVYNHLGPEGNYLEKFGPYFTGRYKTDWGKALNFDGPGSDEVRRFFVENALYWITEFHIDALRLDAVHAILDFSPRTFIEELVESVKERAEELNRRVYLIAESNADDARLIRPPHSGGYGLDAQWNDDFHHALHFLLTGETAGYYQDFSHLRYLIKAVRSGFAYSGEYSRFRGRRRGSSTAGIPAYRFVVFSQNHDQVGNRPLGDRLSRLVSFESLKLAAGIVLLTPGIPLLFMGDEYGETAHFPYFISHSDPEIIEAVRRGRREEFEAFYNHGVFPDPQDEKTFREAKLNRRLRTEGSHKVLLDLYTELIRLRKEIPVFQSFNQEHLEVVGYEKQDLVFMRRRDEDMEVVEVFNFSEAVAAAVLPVPRGSWKKLIDSAEKRWGGSGSRVPDRPISDGELSMELSPRSFAVFLKQGDVK